jgi:hypothetical protein
MNNPTWVDKLTGQIPGKTEGVSLFALLMNVIFGALSLFFGIDFSAETIATLNGLVLSVLGMTLGAKVSRTEATVNQVQAAQTTAVDSPKV